MLNMKEVAGITFAGVAAVALTVLTFSSTDLQAEEMTVHFDDVAKEEQCNDDLSCVTGMLNKKVNFICSMSHKFTDQVVCIFYPPDGAVEFQEGIRDVLQEALKGGEKVEI